MNVYERIFNIVNLLKEVETGISINKISEILGMPTEIIREDIKNIYKDTKFEISIFPYDDTLDTDDFMDELSLGKHDDVDLCADDFDDEYCTLTLTPLENVIWKSVLHKKDNNDDIKIKRLYADDVGICGKVIIIQNAMNKNVNVKIRYKMCIRDRPSHIGSESIESITLPSVARNSSLSYFSPFQSRFVSSNTLPSLFDIVSSGPNIRKFLLSLFNLNMSRTNPPSSIISCPSTEPGNGTSNA